MTGPRAFAPAGLSRYITRTPQVGGVEPCYNSPMRKRRRDIPRELPIFVFLVLLCAGLSLTTRAFASASNLKVLGSDAAAIGIIAVGMTAVIITGGIDLSVAAMLSLSTLVGGGIISRGYTLIGCGVALGVGLGCGLANGVLITRIGMPPIIATLGTLYIIQSAATLISGGQCIILEPNRIAFLGTGFAPLVIMLAVFGLGAFVMGFTRAGRHVYAVGGSEESARLVGVDPRAIKTGVYACSGLLSALAGIVMIAIGSTFQANDAAGYELAAIAAVVIGGTSISGGQGSVLGTLIGVGISTVLRNGAVLVGLEARWAQAVMGAAILAAVAVDRMRRRGSAG
ncbi:MAG: ABC transporter permease [Armatimonadota bacterium]